MRRASIVTVAVIAALSVMTLTVFAGKQCSSLRAHCAVEAGANCDRSMSRSTEMTRVLRRMFSLAALRTI